MLAVEKAVAARVRALEDHTSLASQMEKAALKSFAAKLHDEIPSAVEGESAPGVEVEAGERSAEE